MKHLILALTTVLFISCGNDDDSSAEQQQQFTTPNAPGFAYSESNSTFEETYTTIKSALTSNENIGIVAEVNHRANAVGINEDLRNTRVILFGNPTLGSPLMVNDQQAGLDLPQKILVYEDADGNVIAAYNGTEYLASRHGVGSVSTLPQIKDALEMITTNATGNDVDVNSANSISENQGVVTTISNNDFETTYSNLKSAIEGNENLILVTELDHQANASSVGISLNPTRLLVFGNPNLGTPLMQNAQTTAIDLPQKFLVWETEDGTVNINYNSPEFLKTRHNITSQDDNLNMIANALEMLASAAAN